VRKALARHGITQEEAHGEEDDDSNDENASSERGAG
jgi:hypothetical protein